MKEIKEHDSIQVLGLSRSTYGCLRRGGVAIVRDLMEKDGRDLLRINGFGIMKLCEVIGRMLDNEMILGYGKVTLSGKIYVSDLGMERGAVRGKRLEDIRYMTKSEFLEIAGDSFIKTYRDTGCYSDKSYEYINKYIVEVLKKYGLGPIDDKKIYNNSCYKEWVREDKDCVKSLKLVRNKK